MFCSIIIPTIGRNSLMKAVESALTQTVGEDQFEVIVVNDSGKPLLETKWTMNTSVSIIDTMHRERSFARNAGAAVAKGRYLWFLDDDDWLLPNALIAFQNFVHQHQNPRWIYGSALFIGDNDKELGSLNVGRSGNCFLDAVAETWIPVQASLISAEAFFQVGGFSPEHIGVEDLDLLRRFSLIYDAHGVTESVVCIHRDVQGNRQTRLADELQNIRRGRDQILQDAGAYRRLQSSAGNSAKRRGLLLRVYLAAMMENVRNRNWSRAMSRAVYSLICLLRSSPQIFTTEFWQAVKRSQPWYYDLVENKSKEFNSVAEWLF